MARQIAHIVFPDGGLIVPARTPYDRQLLQEHVLASVHHRQPLRVNVGRDAWVVKRADAEHPMVCGSCDRRINHAVCHESGGPVPFCVACALR